MVCEAMASPCLEYRCDDYKCQNLHGGDALMGRWRGQSVSAGSGIAQMLELCRKEERQLSRHPALPEQCSLRKYWRNLPELELR